MASFFRGLLSSLFPVHRCVHTIARLVITTFKIESGKSTFQPKFINWSYRNRGSVPRTQT
jgi:hypothetical protein